MADDLGRLVKARLGGFFAALFDDKTFMAAHRLNAARAVYRRYLAKAEAEGNAAVADHFRRQLDALPGLIADAREAALARVRELAVEHARVIREEAASAYVAAEVAGQATAELERLFADLLADNMPLVCDKLLDGVGVD